MAADPLGLMRVLVDPGSHHLLNVGDVAMLQACVARLRAAWPGARLDVLTAAPDLLAEVCPEAEPLDAQGRYDWVERHSARPPGGRLATRIERWRSRGSPSAAFLDAVLRADLFLFSGRGGLTDAFAGEARAMMLELEAAARVGVPAAMLGQGIGPLDDRALRSRARAVLPGVGLFGVREPLAAPALLADAGVPVERVIVTGDDAISLVLDAASGTPGTELGFGVRVSEYSGIGAEQAAALAERLRPLAEARGAALLPVPISRHPVEDDGVVLAEREERLTVRETIERAGRCRLVVAGSYHAALFALAQGIPAVCVSGSPYYLGKFAGLEAQFGSWCRVVRLDRRGGVEAAAEAAGSMWETAPSARGELLAAARRQAEQALVAYERLVALPLD